MTDVTPPKKRRRVLRVLLVFVILIVAGIALAPMLLSGAIGGAIASGISDQINGKATLDNASFSWFSDQKIGGLHVVDDQGADVSNVNLTITSGLLGLAGDNPVPLSVDGDLHVTRRADGTISLAGLAKDSPPSEKPPLQGFPGLKLIVDGFTIHLKDEGLGETIVLEDLKGEGFLKPGAPLTLTLDGTTKQGDHNGAVEVELKLSNLIDSGGVIQLAQCTADMTVALKNLRVVVEDAPRTISQLLIGAKSARLGDSLNITAAMQSQDIMLDVDLNADNLIAADGEVQFDPLALNGHARATNLPTSMITSVASLGPIDLNREIGPTIGLDASFGEAMTVNLTSEHLNANLNGAFDAATGRTTIQGGSIDTRVHPELFQALTDLPLAEDAPFRLFIDRLSFEAGDGGMDFDDIVFAGALDLQEEAVVQLPANGHQAAMLMRVPLCSVNVSKLQGSNGVAFVGSVQVIDEQGNTGSLALEDLIFTNFVTKDPDPKPLIQRMEINGAIDATELPCSLIHAFVEDLPESVRTHMTDKFSMRVEAKPVGEGAMRYRSRVEFIPNCRLVGRMLHRDEELDFLQLQARVFLTKENIATLQAESESPVTLLASTTMRLEVDPFKVPTVGDKAWAFDDSPLQGKFSLEAPALLRDVPSINGDLGIFDVESTWSAKLGDAIAISLDGGANIKRNDDHDVCGVGIKVRPSTTGQSLPTLNLTLKDLNFSTLESLLGQEPRDMRRWVGPTGEVVLNIEPTDDAVHAQIAAATPRVTANMQAQLVGGLDAPSHISLTSGDVRGVLRQAMISSWIADTESETPLVAGADVDVQTLINNVTIPWSMIAGDEERNDNDVASDTPMAAHVSVTTGPVSLRQLDNTLLELDGLNLAIDSDDMSGASTLSVRDINESTDEGERRRITLDVKSEGLFNTADQTFDVVGAKHDIEARLRQVPAALIDQFASLQGVLRSAVGEHMTLFIESDEDESGAMFYSGRVTTATKSVVVFRVAHLGDSLALVPYEKDGKSRPPVFARLAMAPTLVDDLLGAMNPLFGGMEIDGSNLVRVLFTDATVPLDGDLSTLTGTLRMDIGDVTFGNEFSLLSVIALASERTGGVTGRIDPVVARIENGVMLYRPFTVKIDKYQMTMRGAVDLGASTADMWIDYPVDGLASTFGEIEHLQGTTIPIHWHGSLDNLKIEPQFDELAGAALRNELEKRIGDAMGEDGGEGLLKSLGDLLKSGG